MAFVAEKAVGVEEQEGGEVNTLLSLAVKTVRSPLLIQVWCLYVMSQLGCG